MSYSQIIFGRRFGWVYLAAIIGFAVLLIEVLDATGYKRTALLYIGVPFIVSVLLFHFNRPPDSYEHEGAFRHFMLRAAIVFLIASMLLLEGLVCMIIFMPIYFLIAWLVFLIHRDIERDQREGKTRLPVAALPAILLALSFEGTAGPLTAERENVVSYSVTTPLGIDQLKANMAKPITFDIRRPWFLAVFPAPDRIDSGSLGVGDVHTLHFTYRRWFGANDHQGEMKLRIAEVGPARVRTEIVSNSSYLAAYMALEGTRVDFEPTPGGTRVTLSVRYRRLLDPVWYFGPLQAYAARLSARYLIDTVIVRGASHG